MSNWQSIKEVWSVFFKLGLSSFGGPVAHIAMMEKEIVTQRNWMTRDHFLDLIGATNLIPGPNSTEMAIHCGYHRAGKVGLWVAGTAFILPAVVITGILAWFYRQFGTLPVVAPLLWGIKPVVIVIIADAVLKFGKKAIKSWILGVIALGVFVGSWLGLNEILLILLAGMVGILWVQTPFKRLNSFSPSLLSLFWIFLKVGSVLFGSGYVLFAYLDAELIQKLGWLTHTQLMDAIAIGQFTPGPVLSSATFIGYQIGGFYGALVATLGIFLPSFILVQVLNPFVPKLRQSKTASAFIDAVNVASVALMVVVLVRMGTTSLGNWKALLIASVAGVCLYRFKKLNPAWLILVGAALGVVMQLLT